MASGKGLKLFGTSRLTGASVLYIANFVFPLIISLVTMIIGLSRMSDKSSSLLERTMYLASLFVLNALDLAVNLVANTEAEDSSYITAFYEPLTAVLLSRVLINLQAAHQKAQTLDSKNLMLHGEKFQASDRILGSLGASIVPGWLSYENTAAATNPSDAEKGNPSPSTIEVEIPQVQ
ncbi:hypothetical protein V8D89_015395 [Ganoderma adspersum]